MYGQRWRSTSALEKAIPTSGEPSGPSEVLRVYSREYGWPFVILGRYKSVTPLSGPGLPDISEEKINNVSSGIHYSTAALDFTVGILVLFAVWFLFECLIRRRAARM